MGTYREQYKAGLLGEWKAAAYLKRKGMKIITKRFRCGDGEIDLICRDEDTLCFVEVKYRPEGMPGDGIAAVDREKIRRCRNAAKGYLKAHPCECLRFDVVEITKSGVRHLKNAF